MIHVRFPVLLRTTILALLLPLCLHSQPDSYPRQYFRNPLGIPILLAGNFGECRSGHFHSGIDIKTDGRENLPVFAAAEGYISRVKMEPGGFGHGIYITHPNGYTTLYAHLNRFMPGLQAYLRRQQYERESWTADLSLKPGQFPVTKGQQIAWSGNTGASTAPHLHFEIRDTKTEHPLNPQLFGFDIADNRPPKLLQLALYDRSLSLYEQSPRLLALRLKDDQYQPGPDTLSAAWNTGLGIVVNDYMNGSDNTLAFYTAEWYLDSVLQGRIRLDDIGYDETRYLHAYVDYKTRELKQVWVQCLFRLPGNRLHQVYEALGSSAGQLSLKDDAVHLVHILLRDAGGNASQARFYLRRGPETTPPDCEGPGSRPSQGPLINDPSIRFAPPEGVFYEDFCFRFSRTRDPESLSDRYQLHEAYVPMHRSTKLQIRPERSVPAEWGQKVVLVYRDGQEESGQAAQPLDQGWYEASIRKLGEYRLMVDTIPPVVRPQVPIRGRMSGQKRLSFTAKEAMTSISSFRAELDGRWLLFEQHSNTWFYEFDAHCPPGKHTLVVKVTDENGNETVQTFTFSR